MVPSLTEPLRSDALCEALKSARAIEDELLRAEALAALVPLTTLYPLWHETLRFLAGRTRIDLPADLCAYDQRGMGRHWRRRRWRSWP